MFFLCLNKRIYFFSVKRLCVARFPGLRTVYQRIWPWL
ncbi:unnamed protein product [Brassica oleracea]